MVGIYWVDTVPASPFLNQNFYISWSTNGSFTGAFCSVASVVAPIIATGGSYAAFYRAGSVPVGTWAIYGYIVKGTAGSFIDDHSITIQDSEIAEPVATVYALIKTNLGATYASTLVTTGWFNSASQRPQITVTSGSRSDMVSNLYDTFRKHEETVYIDTWVSGRDAGTSQFGTTSVKRARNLLDNEVKRIVNANRKAASNKWIHMILKDRQMMDEVGTSRKIFRTRYTLQIKWNETIA